MRDRLVNLMELQRVDNELDALESLKGDLPQKVRELESELNRLNTERENYENELNELKRSKAHWDTELKALQDQLAKYQEQLYSVQSNREYDAITVEIDSTKEKIDDAETRIVEFMEREDQIQNALEDLASRIDAGEDELEERQKELAEKIKATEKEYRDWEDKRKTLVDNLNKPLLSQYRRIRRVKGHNAVVNVNKYACGGCFSAIPPQKVVEIRNMNQLITCESCGRILVYENEREAVTS